MAKWLTLNTHSWMEVNALKKLFDLAEHILAEKYDVICLQEVNQLIESDLATEDSFYQKFREPRPYIRIILPSYSLII